MKDSITISARTGLPQIRMTFWDFWELDSFLKARAGERSWRADAILGLSDGQSISHTAPDRTLR
jgi:hypothetical protein